MYFYNKRVDRDIPMRYQSLYSRFHPNFYEISQIMYYIAFKTSASEAHMQNECKTTNAILYVLRSDKYVDRLIDAC